MFNTRDLSGYVCRAADAVQLKFGEREASVGLSLRASFHSASLLHCRAIELGAIMVLFRALLG